MKGFKSLEEQIEILKNRGMIITDKELARKKLQENNYYNIINGYKDIFIDSTKLDEQFQTDVTFEEIYALYSFDRTLRSTLLRYIIELENILRSLISYEFAKVHGHDNYLIFNNFETLTTLKNTGIKNANLLIEERACKIQKLIAEMQQDLAIATEKSKYVKHYVVKYGYVPIWVLVNSITLGRLSKFFNLMNQAERIEVSKKWNIKEEDLKQYIKILAMYRNQCAHDERIYNYNTEKISIADTVYHSILKIPVINGRFEYGKNDLFSLAIIFKVLLPEDDFKTFVNKISGHLHSLEKKMNPLRFNEVREQMGFPINWFEIKKS